MLYYIYIYYCVQQAECENDILKIIFVCKSTFVFFSVSVFPFLSFTFYLFHYYSLCLFVSLSFHSLSLSLFLSISLYLSIYLSLSLSLSHHPSLPLSLSMCFSLSPSISIPLSISFSTSLRSSHLAVFGIVPVSLAELFLMLDVVGFLVGITFYNTAVYHFVKYVRIHL